MASRNLTVGGIHVNLYGSPLGARDRSPSKDGLAVLFLLHGRFGSAAEERMASFAHRFIDYSQSKPGKDLLVVTFDQRNHGQRKVDGNRNRAWQDKPTATEIENHSHAADMYSIQVGTAKDVSFLIDFLPPILFPNDERAITDWYVAGISLGGHSTWLSLAHERRISLGIPIIGSPDFLTLLSNRARTTPAPLGPIPLAPPFFPNSLLATVKKTDPIHVPDDVWKGRKILVLSGGIDELVNYEIGGSGIFVEKLKQQGVDVEAVIEPGV
ncbi:hypothetical protein T439DRAFT_340070 [Meredithblackwellia eburnea MCA 4105]